MRQRPQKISSIALGLLFSVSLITPGTHAGSNRDRDAAVRMLSRGLRVEPNGDHHVVLRALRQLGDEQLKPLFEALAFADHPALRIHGMLGSAELSDQGRVDPRQIASMRNPAVRGELLSTALDAKLISPKGARAMLDWDGLDQGVKLLICAWQIERGTFHTEDKSIIRNAAKSQRIGRRALANLLLLQLGDRGAINPLMQLNHHAAPLGGAVKGSSERSQPKDPSRDAVRLMLLRTALRHKLYRVRGWAFSLARLEPGNSRVGRLALRVALRFGSQQALELWRRRLQDAGDSALAVRYGLMGLRVAPWREPAAFTPLPESDHALMGRIGRACRAIADGQKKGSPAICKLVRTNHPLVQSWAVDYAAAQARPAQATAILMAVIESAGKGSKSAPPSRLKIVSRAARVLVQTNASKAINMLDPLLRDEQTQAPLQRAVLRGMNQAAGTPGKALADNLGPLADLQARELALLWKARTGAKLSRVDLADLGVLVRGGGRLSLTLRTQAAWEYLKQIGQADRAVEALAHSIRTSSR